MNILMSIVGFILAVLTPLANLLLTDPTAPFDKEVAAVEEKVGGFMKGICHTDREYELITGANIEWLREDIPIPIAPDGSRNIYYDYWKAEMQEYVDNGIRIMGVTPYPDDYIAVGLDPRIPENEEKIKEIAVFYLEDLKGIVDAYQITNEMGVDRFTEPLTLEEAARFIGIQLEAMYPVKGDIITGYNLCAQAMLQLPGLMREYHQYCDYVGIDVYLGCFENITKNADMYLTALKYVRFATGKPVMMCEFGYIGLGEPKSAAEKKEILEGYGYSSEKEAIADIDNFIAQLPPDIKEEFDEYYADLSAEEKGALLFDGEYSNHIYCELAEGIGLYGFEHTAEGQAKFYEYIIPKIENLDYVIGAFVYEWQDNGRCYVCGQNECPVETKWGIVDYEGNPKPAYYAVQKAFGEID